MTAMTGDLCRRLVSVDTRRHDLDALRAFAMLLGIALHAAPSFMDFPWVVQGECLTGLGQWAEAESSLLDGYQGLHENPDAIPGQIRVVRLREALERIVNLYEARHAAEPDAGHDAKVAEWREKLDELEATTQPTTRAGE